MWNLFKRAQDPPTSRSEIVTIGNAVVRSGSLYLADTQGVPVHVEIVPEGEHTVRATVVRKPEGEKRIAKISVTFDLAAPDARDEVGSVGLKSGVVLMADTAALERYLASVGSVRIGHVSSPQHRKIALLLEKKFALTSHPVGVVASEFEEPISNSMEAEIRSYLHTLPETFSRAPDCFSIRTRNPFDRIARDLKGGLWQTVTLDEDAGANLIALAAGSTTGELTVTTLSSCGALVGVELVFPARRED